LTADPLAQSEKDYVVLMTLSVAVTNMCDGYDVDDTNVLPDPHVRRLLAGSLLRGLAGFAQATPKAANNAVSSFVDQTEGMLLIDMTAIAQLGRNEGLGFSSIGDAVRRYKVDVSEDPWARIDHEKIRAGADIVRTPLPKLLSGASLYPARARRRTLHPRVDRAIQSSTGAR
jgi:hypothetical protein